MALGSANREVNMTAGEVLFVERAVNSYINSEQTTTKFFFVFELAFLLGTHKPSSESHSSSVTVRTASTAKHPSIGPAPSSKVHTVVRSCRPECDNASK